MDEVFAVERAMNSALRLQITCRPGGRSGADGINERSRRRRENAEGQALSDLENPEFVGGVLICLRTDEERQEVLDAIEAGDLPEPGDITLFALNIHLDREEGNL